MITDGVDGRLFPFGDDDEFIAALDWALSHPSELREMGERAYQRATQCTWPKYSSELVKVLEPLVRKSELETA